MGKTLCDWSKSDIRKHAEKLMELIREPRYYCRKCTRSAHVSEVLCKPKKMPSIKIEEME